MLRQRKDGSYALHSIEDDEALVVWHNDFWHVQIADTGIHAKTVYTTRTLEDAIECAGKIGKKVIR